MPRIDYAHYDIYIAICKAQPEYPTHWILLLHHPGAVLCTYFHSVGTPGTYELAIEPNKRFDSWSFESTNFLARIPASAGAIVEDQAYSVPAQSCQCWSSYMIYRLQLLNLISQGTYEHWRDFHMTSRREDRGPGCFCNM